MGNATEVLRRFAELPATTDEEVDELLLALLMQHESLEDGKWFQILKDFAQCAQQERSKQWLQRRAKKVRARLIPDVKDEAETGDNTDTATQAEGTPTGLSTARAAACAMSSEKNEFEPDCGAVPKLGSMRLKPSDVFFTHDSIRSTFRDGRLLRETLRELEEAKITIDDIPTIQVCWHAAKDCSSRFWTYTGNRRLWVFRQLQERGYLHDIEVRIVGKKVPEFRMTTKNGGTEARVRGELLGPGPQ